MPKFIGAANLTDGFLVLDCQSGDGYHICIPKFIGAANLTEGFLVSDCQFRNEYYIIMYT